MGYFNSFPCVRCGHCCKSIKGVAGLEGYAMEDGSCIHLQGGDTCGIAGEMPTVCDVAALYERGDYNLPWETRDEFFARNLRLCLGICEERGDLANASRLSGIIAKYEHHM